MSDTINDGMEKLYGPAPADSPEWLESIKLQKKQYPFFKEDERIKGFSTLYYYDADLIDELLDIVTAKLAESYRHGYNDNARDCTCDEFPVKPHKHLMDDGKSYDIKPDIPAAPDSSETDPPEEGYKRVRFTKQ